jgi:hypothetical protein
METEGPSLHPILSELNPFHTRISRIHSIIILLSTPAHPKQSPPVKTFCLILSLLRFGGAYNF